MRVLLFLSLALWLSPAFGKRSATPIANPHQAASAGCAPVSVARDAILAAPLETQADTLVAIETVEIASMPVLVYNFKQPPRLSPLELPFKVLPVSRINAAGVVALRVDDQQALDSWFPGFRWDVLLDVTCAEPAHIGWRFSSLDKSEHTTFYALIVKTKDDDLLSAVSSFAEALRAKLAVGVPATPWMLALLATQTPAKLSL